MKQITYILLFCLTAAFSSAIKAQSISQLYSPIHYATMTFSNQSDYSLVVKIIDYHEGGLYKTVYLSPHSCDIVCFSESATYITKIKATHHGFSSYHKGSSFSVTCTDKEYSEGKLTFQMSTYGSGLGPSISSEEFERNY